MRYSRTLIPTVKEVPADAEIVSHQVMIRAGFMRKIAAGTYAYLPAGRRVLLKIMNIVREEMNAAGAQEILMPAVQPIELWQKTGRDVDYGETMAKFIDRHGRTNVLAPTAEEVITHLGAGEINSYKQLPINLYQISFKFRDEFRPRFGVLRSREFIMKDSYSFHAGAECLDKEYWNMYRTYERIFNRCGLEYVIVEAETGEMGGSGSHQFTVPCENGEDVIVYTEDGSYAANIEKAPVDPAQKRQGGEDTPATEDVRTPNAGTIEEVCAFLKTKPEQMIKTLIYSFGEGRTAVAVVRGDHEVNMEKVTQAVSGGHIELAEPSVIEKVTGACVGFAGPTGLAEKVDLMMIDHSVAAMTAGVSGANKTDYHTKNVVPGRDFPLEGDKIKVLDIRNAVQGDTYQGKKLLFRRGIEVGQVFKLGTKYSEKLSANYLDDDGKQKPCLMGCYGIGVNRIFASAIELYNDKDGPVMPVSIAPWEVIVTPAGETDEIQQACEGIYQGLFEKGIDVLLDDRDMRAGGKFKDADLLGIPIRVTVGKKTIAEKKAEVKLRSKSEIDKISLDEVTAYVCEKIGRMKEKLLSD